MATMFQVKRFSVDDYAKMVQSGILMDDERVELIDGEVRYMSPIGSRHIGMVAWLSERLMQSLGGTAIVFIQSSIQLDDFSEPQTDIGVLLRHSDYFRLLQKHQGKARGRPAPDRGGGFLVAL